MKTRDRLFIAWLVLLLCSAGMRSMHDFAKNRNLNGINIIGEAKAQVPADTAIVHMNLIATGETAEFRETLLNQRIGTLTGLVEGGVILFENGVNRSSIENCWFNGKQLNQPCQYSDFSLQFTGTNLSQTLTSFQQKISELSRVMLDNLVLSLQNPKPHRDIIRKQAIADAELQAKATAKALGINLGKLLVYSENGFDGNNWGNPIPSRYIHWNALLSSCDIELIVKSYQTYAIK